MTAFENGIHCSGKLHLEFSNHFPIGQSRFADTLEISRQGLFQFVQSPSDKVPLSIAVHSVGSFSLHQKAFHLGYVQHHNFIFSIARHLVSHAIPKDKPLYFVVYLLYVLQTIVS